jgi:hypothetical protein
MHLFRLSAEFSIKFTLIWLLGLNLQVLLCHMNLDDYAAIHIKGLLGLWTQYAEYDISCVTRILVKYYGGIHV